MRPPRFLLATVLVAAGFAASAQAPAPAAPKSGDANSGKNKVFQCQGCHGVADWKTVFPETYRVPKLGGQKPAYIVAALRAYKSGERDFATMRGMVTDMTDQDMADIAAYYGGGGGQGPAEKK
ncbi:MAG: c-type cytochrome [Usitatibacter sp.]